VMRDPKILDVFFDRAGVRRNQQQKEKLFNVVRLFAHIPYENITKIIRYSQTKDVVRARRMPEEVLSEHFQLSTGGTCFSLTFALRDILCELDFKPRIMMADMKAGPNVHCAVRLSFEGNDYLLDPGYLLNRPIMLFPDTSLSLPTPMNTIVLDPNRENDECIVSVIRKGEKKFRYRLKTVPVADEEFFRHWDSSFSMNMMRSLTLSQVTPEGQLYFSRSRIHFVQPDTRKSKNVRGNEVSVISRHFNIESHMIESALSIVKKRALNNGF